jgi:two-component system nitrogen regulation sensor histidine kinase GlnL
VKTAPDTLRAAAFDLWPEAALLLDAADIVVSVNEAAEELFGRSLSLLGKKPIAGTLAPGSRFAALIERCRLQVGTVRERGVEVALLGFPSFIADVAAAPFLDDGMLVTLRVRSATFGVDRNADPAGLQSVMGLGQMLAHEVKNPLAGIRGAAQLLKRGVRADDAPLAQLIVDETDRIKRLIDRMEAFGGDDPPERAPVNIHRVLDRVRALAANGVAGDLFLSEHYDPSLPDAWGEEDQLIQVFLNLTKNAAEAAHGRGDGRGEISISTAYRHGVRIRGADGSMIGGAPLEVKVADNGGGVPAKMRDHLFEPFVTSKAQGVGLGLALVAKVVAGHGGMIDFESEPGRTVFRVLLPTVPSTAH